MSRRNASRRPNSSPKKSPFQARLENIMRVPFGGGNTPRGVHHTLLLIERASEDEISSLHPDYSPISMVLRYLHTNVRRRNFNFLEQIIRACQLKGIKINGCDHIDGYLERPLVLAASLWRPKWVEALLIAGADPSETDGRGRNAFFAAFDNRDMTKQWFIRPRNGAPSYNEFWHDQREQRRRDYLHHYRIKIAHLIFQTGLVTPRLSLCITIPRMLYVNHQTPCGTPLLAALIHQRQDEYTFLVHHCRATLTDTDYLILRQLNKMHCLKNAVRVVHDLIKRRSDHTPSTLDILATFQPYSKYNHWSFPPTYHITIALTKHCGLPKEVFEQHLQPFLSRDWFFTEAQLQLDATNEEIREEFQGYTL